MYLALCSLSNNQLGEAGGAALGKALEQNIASLEGGRHGLMFGSGLAAQAACIHLLQSGDHVVVSDDVYGGTYRQFDKVFKQFGITYTRADMTDLNAAEAAFTAKTRMVWIETPTNPLLKVIDIGAVARLAKSKGAITGLEGGSGLPSSHYHIGN